MLKKAVFVIALGILFSSQAFAQTTSGTSTRVTLATSTPTPVATSSLVGGTTATQLVTATPTPTPTPVTTTVVEEDITTTTTTKGGQPVSGSAEMTVLFALAGVALMSYGAFKASRR